MYSHRSRPRGWLATYIGFLVALGLVFRNLQAVWASAAMTAPKKGGFRLLSDYRAVNKQIEKVPVMMPKQNLVSSPFETRFWGYECGRVFPAGVEPGSHPRKM